MAALVLAEAALRIAGFRFVMRPEGVQFGWPDPTVIDDMFEPDAQLVWVRKGYEADLASARTRSPDVVFMGDSCTQFADYERRFARGAAARGWNGNLSVWNAGVGGYSSCQGLKQLERDVLELSPRIVTLYYGWNDHWVGFGVDDAGVARIAASGLHRFADLRVAQLIDRLRAGAGAAPDAGSGPRTAEAGWPVRVSEADFRANLERMVDLARARGITPLLVTAPSTHETGKEPEHLRERHLPDLRQLVPLHRRYVEIVREVARERRAPLCDLKQRFDELLLRDRAAGGEWKLRYFGEDGIHFRPDGMERAAEFLLDAVEANGLVDRLRPR